MIDITGVNKTFILGDSTVHALNDINLHIAKGEYVSVMGPSGSGKSTLMNMLGLLDRPDNGRYLLNGVDTQSLDENERARLRREQIGFVFQSYHLIARLTAREKVERPLMRGGGPANNRREQGLAFSKNWVSPDAPTTCRTSCLAANANGWRSGAASSCSRLSCSPMNRPATLILVRVRRSRTFWRT